MSTFQSFGAAAAVAAINEGDFSQFQRILRDANSKEPARQNAGRLALRGVLFGFSDFLIETKSHGVRFTKAQPPSRTDIEYSFQVGAAFLSATGQTLVNMVTEIRKCSPSLRVQLREATEKPIPPPPQPVAIVSMPARKTVTDIARNGAGEITSSLQLESDF